MGVVREEGTIRHMPVDKQLSYDQSRGIYTIKRGRYHGIGTRYCFGVLYVGLRYLDSYKRGIFRYSKVGTKDQLADAFTKPLPRDDFIKFREWMGVKVFESEQAS